MYDAFTSRPNYTPYNAVPNQVPLTEGIAAPPPRPGHPGETGPAAKALNQAEAQNTAVPANEKATAAAWQAWILHQHTVGNSTVPGFANPRSSVGDNLVPPPHDWKVPFTASRSTFRPRLERLPPSPAWAQG